MRLAWTCLAAGLLAFPAIAPAQEAPPLATTTNSPGPTTNSVGPSDLQNFNLPGTVTRPADRQPSATAPATRSTTSRLVTAPPATAQTAPAPARVERRMPPPASESVQVADQATQPLRQTQPASSVTVALPRLGEGTAGATASAPAQTAQADPVSSEPASAPLAPAKSFPIWPWLLAAAALGAGGAFLFLRWRGGHAYAGGPQLDRFTPPEPAPTPAPRPAPRPEVPKAPTPPPVAGIVSTRLRPWVDIAFQPIQCTVEDDKVVIDFDIELLNSGSAPAHAVLAEASLFNAGSTQDQVIGAFFENPTGVGERIVTIEPLRRVVVRNQVVAPRSQVQEYELAGRKVFVPIIAFNALYRWSGGEGQTSVAYMLGGDTRTDKLAPFRFDSGKSAFRGIAARPLTIGVRA